MGALRKIRLHLEERDGRVRKAATIFFTGRDASLYLVPHAPTGDYFYGVRSMSAGQTEDTIRFREQVSAAAQPKLSIHETGCVHIYANGEPKAGPLQIPPLTELRGENIASVRWDAIASLPEAQGKPKVTTSEQDWALGVPDGVESGVLLLYANGEQPSFSGFPLQAVLPPIGSAAGPPVFFGLLALQKDRLSGAEGEGGVSVLAGFDPRKPDDEALDYLYLRGL